MGVVVDQVRLAAPTVNGTTQDFTVAGFGTPKAAIFIVSNANADNTAINHAAISFGLTDGTRQYAITSSSDNGTPNGVNERRIGNTEVIRLFGLTRIVDAVATFTAWITDGVRITWDDAPTSAHLVTCILFGGTDLTAYAGDFILPGTLDGTLVVTVPGFPTLGGFGPDQVIAAGIASNSFNTDSIDVRMMIGFSDKQPTVKQASSNWRQTDNASVGAGHNWVDNRYAGYNSVLAVGLDISVYTTTGFTVTQRLGGGAGQRQFYLALGYNNTCSHWVGVVDSPVAVGVKVESAPNFKPQFVLQLPTCVDVVNRASTESALLSPPAAIGAGSFAVAAMTAPGGTGKIYTTAVCDDDGAATMATRSWASPSLTNLSDTAVILQRGTNSSLQFVATGWSLDYTSFFNSVIRKWPTLVIGEFISGTTNHLLTGTISGNAVSTGTIQAALVLAGTATGDGTVAGTVTAAFALSAILTGGGTTAGPLVFQPGLSGVLSGSGTVSGTVILTSGLSATITGNGAVTGDLMIVGGTTNHTLTSSGVTGIGSVIGDLLFNHGLTGVPTGSANASGAIVNVYALAGSLSGAGTTGGNVVLSYSFAGSPTGSATTLGTLGTAYLVTGSASGGASLAGELTNESIGTWLPIGPLLPYVAAENQDIAYAFRVFLRASIGRVNARLYNETDSTPVSGSEMFTESTVMVYKQTPALALLDTKSYRCQFARSVGGNGEVQRAEFVVV